MFRWLTTLFACVLGCGFTSTVTPAGTPNLVRVSPNLWRMGQPPTEAAWRELPTLISPSAAGVVIVKLDDEEEGDDSPAEKLFGWTVVRVPLPPKDDQPWTVLVVPKKEDVHRALYAILDAQAAGKTVAWHCVHGRDRTGLITALVGMKALGWSKKQAWKDMIAHGFRWELPDLDAYWIEDVR
jgi:protein-tyrosine phosphatase